MLNIFQKGKKVFFKVKKISVVLHPKEDESNKVALQLLTMNNGVKIKATTKNQKELNRKFNLPMAIVSYKNRRTKQRFFGSAIEKLIEELRQTH